MKVLCEGLDLSEASLKVVKAISSKTTNPILEGIKIEAKNDKLILTATDSDFTIQKVISADVKMEGKIVVPGKLFCDFIRKLSNQKILMSVENDMILKLCYGENEGCIQIMDESEFPKTYSISEPTEYEVRAKDFKETISKVIFCVSSDDSRPILKGCLLEVVKNQLTAVALDGYRLAMTKCELIKSGSDNKIVIPQRTLSEIIKMFSDGVKDNVKISVNKNYVEFSQKDIKIISRLLEGEYINYKQIIPNEFTTSIKAQKENLEDALDRAIVMSINDKNSLVKFNIKENILQVTSNTEIANIREMLSIKVEGKDIKIAFNAKYYSECLKSIVDDNIKICFNGGIAPCVITPVDSDEFLYLLLPVRVND